MRAFVGFLMVALVAGCAAPVQRPPRSEAAYAMVVALAAAQQRQYDDAIRLYGRALALGGLTPDQRADALNGRAEAALALHREADALADLDAAVALAPALPKVLANRGRAELALARYPEALRDLDAAIRVAPDLAEAYTARGMARLRTGDTIRATADFDTAIRLKPYLAEPFAGRGEAERAAGDNATALADFDTAMRLAARAGDPESADLARLHL